MKASTYGPCLLTRDEDGFGVVGLQTDDTLILADTTFAHDEEEQLAIAGFLAKP